MTLSPRARGQTIAIVVIVATLGLTECGSAESEPVSSSPPTVSVSYEAEGSGVSTADIGYETSSGGRRTRGSALPLRKVSDNSLGLTISPELGAFVYLSVRNRTGLGSIICRIVGSAGQIIAENMSHDDSAAECQGHAA